MTKTNKITAATNTPKLIAMGFIRKTKAKEGTAKSISKNASDRSGK